MGGCLNEIIDLNLVLLLPFALVIAIKIDSGITNADTGGYED